MRPEVESYISQFPEEVQLRLRALRVMVAKLVPAAVEGFAYGMPAYKLNGKPLLYFGGFAKHIGLYAMPSGHEAFKDMLKDYVQGKGSVQFPLNKEMPYEIIEKLILYREREILQVLKKTLPKSNK